MYSTTQDFYRAELEYRRELRRRESRPLFGRIRGLKSRNQITDGGAAA